MLLESIAMLVLTISEVVPIAMGLNWDLIWFGIIVVVVLETGMIRPPVINVFIVESIAPRFRWSDFSRDLPVLVCDGTDAGPAGFLPRLTLFLPQTIVGG